MRFCYGLTGRESFRDFRETGPSCSWLAIVLLLFQFDCTNTLNDQILEDVKVEMEPSDSDFEVVSYIPRPSLPYNTPGTTYTLIKLPEDASSGL